MSRFKDQLDSLVPWAPAARASDPDTSHLAAERDPNLTRKDRWEVLRTHAEHPWGLTDHELAAIINRQQTSCGKRRGELRDAGLIEETRERRPAPSGSLAIVWKITADGIAAAGKRAA